MCWYSGKYCNFGLQSEWRYALSWCCYIYLSVDRVLEVAALFLCVTYFLKPFQHIKHQLQKYENLNLLSVVCTQAVFVEWICTIHHIITLLYFLYYFHTVTDIFQTLCWNISGFVRYLLKFFYHISIRFLIALTGIVWPLEADNTPMDALIW
jgi:hypothetical protein